MAKVKNVSGEALRLLSGRRVEAGQVIDVPDVDVESYTCQDTTWKAVENKTTGENE